MTFASPVSAAPKKCSSTQTPGKSRIGHFYGISRATSRCSDSSQGSGEIDPGAAATKPYQGTPPLINNGGPVMSTPSTGDQVVVTPVFWAPAGYSFTMSYQNVIDTYLTNLAHDSDTTTNVFASTYQYSGSNGPINYRMTVASSPILDADALPTAGCTTNSGGVYSDGTGYSTCLDDAQIQTELSSVISANHLTTDLGHLVVLFLPKGVESCFYAGNPAGQQCTLNSTKSAAYCAYHSSYGTTAPKIYALMPFPAYQSPTGYTCAGEGLSNSGPVIQSPNGDADADVEISPLSHEMAESITDPEGDAWFDVSGNENGDDCAYIYGALSGSPGALYNQTVNGAHYLTQEEFSNAAYVPNTSGCVQSTQPVLPTVSSVSPTGGSGSGGGSVTITGTGFAGASAVSFGGAASPTYTINDPTSITATVPAGSGAVDVTVTTGAGTSSTSNNDKYTYTAVAPTITSVAPSSGSAAGGTSVTVTGTGFSGVTGVSFGGSSGQQLNVTSSTQLTVVAPPHSSGTVDVHVTGSSGTSATSPADNFTYVAAPTVTSLSPSSGPVGGGSSVTITGTNLGGATGVSFGAQPAANVVVVSPSQITADAPAGSPGTVDVIVTTAGGSSDVSAGDQYTYISAPTVTSVAPASGPTAGGTAVTIGGSGFSGVSDVSFGDQPATNVVVVSPSQITADAPAGSAGAVDVTVTTAAGASATSPADQFTYLAAPTVTSVGPDSGPTSGGQSLTVTGTGFAPGAAVRVGGALGSAVNVISATELTVTTPSHVAGTVDVTVTTGGATTATSASDRYTYLARPTVSKVSPNSGPTAGGTSITITGTGFATGDGVTVGASAATAVVVVSSTSITARVPSHAAGTVDVQITSPGGTSAVVKADHYTYLARPHVSRLSSSRGSASGGKTITIIGSRFVPGLTVRFGKVAARSVKYLSATRLTVKTPRHAKRTVNVRVTTRGGSSPTSAATRFTFQ